MEKDSGLSYFRGAVTDEFSFYRIPKLLFTDTRFSGLSLEAKVLYALLLDRVSLSAKNAWRDDLGRVFVYFTIGEVTRLMGVGKDKAIRLMRALSDVGLIKKKKQGQGKPDKIYVLNFNSGKSVENTSCNPTSKNGGSKITPSAIPQTDTPRGRRLPPLDIAKPDTNNTDNNKTEKIINKYSNTNYQSPTYKRLTECRRMAQKILYPDGKIPYIGNSG